MQLCIVYIEQQQLLLRLSCPSVLSFVVVSFALLFVFLSLVAELSSDLRGQEREMEGTCASFGHGSK